MLTLRIDEILKEKNKSVYWLSKQCGMSANNMGKICSGETTRISFDILEKICVALECTPNDLIKSDDPFLKRLLAYQFHINKLSKNYELDNM